MTQKTLAEAAAEVANEKLRLAREANPAWGTPERPLVVAICMPVWDHKKMQTDRAFRCLWKAHRQPGGPLYGSTHLFDTWAVHTEGARVELTAQALAAEPKVTHVLFVDADMTFPPDALKRLVQHDVPIVGGLCFNRRHPYNPILLRYHPDEVARFGHGGGDGQKKTFGFVYHYPDNAVIEVDATGGAFILIKREVLEKVLEQDNAGKNSSDLNTRPWWGSISGLSEDFSFCLRAQRAGYKILIDTGCKIGHIGEVIVDQEFAEKNRKFKWDEWNPLAPITDGSPIVSITIPTYNQRLDFLKASILSAVHQSVPTEVIVVDDGSTPPLSEQPEFMEWFGDVKREIADAAETPEEEAAMKNRLQLVSYVKQDGTPDCRNKGISAALNAGIRAMDKKVQYWCWLSSDDLFMPDKCKEQLAVIVQMQAKASYTRWQGLLPGVPHPTIAQIYLWSSIKEQMALLSQACVVNGSTVMLHRSIFDEIGLFDESIKYGQDWDFWCRVGICHFWAPVKEILVSRRQEGNLTARIEQSPEMKAERDHEDARIRAQYMTYRPRGV